MNITTHRIRIHLFGDRKEDYGHISLPAIPGVTLDTDRHETAPATPAIKAVKRKPSGAAVRALSAYTVLRNILVDIAEDRA